MTNQTLDLDMHSNWEMQFDEDRHAYHAVTSYLSQQHACLVLTREIEGEEEGSRFTKYLYHAYHFNDVTILVSRGYTAPHLEIKICASRPKIAGEVLEEILKKSGVQKKSEVNEQ